MSKKILITTQDPNENRVAVIEDGVLVDFDSENVVQKPLRGNVYLARVVRVEPSLQAVFVEYSEGKYGFLPFSEIHSSYYRIPVDDRSGENNDAADEAEAELEATPPVSAEPPSAKKEEFHYDDGVMAYPSSVYVEPEIFGVTNAEHTPPPAKKKRKRRYNVQEVIHNKQVLLIQVIKDERGSKGAAVTTYLSLVGQYCILMPNAGDRGGGISKRIHNDDDRKRLKDIVGDLGIPDKMSVIIRTAGQERNKKEIKRDYEHLLQIWDEIRKKTLESSAPQLIHEEADFLKRVVRDFYKKEIDEIIVDTKSAYKKMRDFMKHLSTSSLKKVKLYEEELVSLFNFYNVERQILNMVSPRVELQSGGSIVIGQTEALVAIDVNSGRATKERHIDTTALKTNLEAAKEIARQLRLRDLSGLIVIDFIDMSDPKHIYQVERVFRQETANDHAKIQIANIGQFGLLEMSRQRLRASVMETYGEVCQHCQGRGVTYSKRYFVSTILHFLEQTAFENKGKQLVVYTSNFICHELLNCKRKELLDIEQKSKCSINVKTDDNLEPLGFTIDSGNGTPFRFSLGQGESAEGNKHGHGAFKPAWKGDRKHAGGAIEDGTSKNRANVRKRKKDEIKVPSSAEVAESCDVPVSDEPKQPTSGVSAEARVAVENSKNAGANGAKQTRPLTDSEGPRKPRIRTRSKKNGNGSNDGKAGGGEDGVKGHGAGEDRAKESGVEYRAKGQGAAAVHPENGVNYGQKASVAEILSASHWEHEKGATAAQQNEKVATVAQQVEAKHRKSRNLLRRRFGFLRRNSVSHNLLQGKK